MADLDAQRDGVGLFEPETLLPAQYFPAAAAPESGERRLMFAVLSDGLILASRGSLSAQEWMRGEDFEWPFSFRRLCELFEYDADELRRRLLGRTAPVRRIHRLAESGRPGLNASMVRGGRAA